MKSNKTGIPKGRNTDLWNVMMQEMEIEYKKRFKKGVNQEHNRILGIVEEMIKEAIGSATPPFSNAQALRVSTMQDVLRRISKGKEDLCKER